jgi:DNA-directed RNA polymerase subunit M/transcription elongation factor TFIIS
MPIEFSCTNCHTLLRVPDGSEGKQSQCPSCGIVAKIPFTQVSAQAAQPATDGRVTVRCPQCQYSLRCKPELIGAKGQCKQCKHIFIIGQADNQLQQATAELVFSCPKCDQLFDGKAEMQGRKGRCHMCGEVFAIELRKANKQKPIQVTHPKQTGSTEKAAKPKSQSTKPQTLAADQMQLACGGCSGLMAVPKTAAGQTIVCPHCQQQLQVPGGQQASAARPSVFDQAESEIFANLEVPSAHFNTRPVPVDPYPFPNLPGPETYSQSYSPAPPYRSPAPAPSSGSPLDIFNFGGAAAAPQPYAQPYPVSSSSSNYGASPTGMANPYLLNAESELRQERATASGNASGSLRTAQVILIIVGVLTILLNGFLFLQAENEVDAVMRGGDAQIDRGSLLLFVRVFYGAFMGLGVAFIALGILVYKFPVFCPVAGLVLYILGIAVTGILDPATLIKGIVLKVIFIIALIKAVNDGAYYRK